MLSLARTSTQPRRRKRDAASPWRASPLSPMRIPAPLAVSLLMVLLGSAPFARQAQQPAQPQPPAGTAAPPPQTAQPERSQQGPIRTGINYVRVDAIVTDRQGNPVLDLKPEDQASDSGWFPWLTTLVHGTRKYYMPSHGMLRVHPESKIGGLTALRGFREGQYAAFKRWWKLGYKPVLSFPHAPDSPEASAAREFRPEERKW